MRNIAQVLLLAICAALAVAFLTLPITALIGAWMEAMP